MWAKHDRASDGWLPLWRHMADSGAVAGLLWDKWLPQRIRDMVARSLRSNTEDARRLAVWLATTHDIGKATPAFACQVESLSDRMREAGLDMPFHKQMTDRRLAPHGLAGQLLINQWLMERHGWQQRATSQFGIIAGGHHGVPPTSASVKALTDHPALLRTPDSEQQWRAVQDELLDTAAEVCGVADLLPAWQHVKLPQPAQVLLTALVIVADWIASNPDLFPYYPGAPRDDAERIAAAWRGLSLPPPWEAREPDGKLTPEALFTERFSLPTGARIRPVQAAAVEAARAMESPGLMIIEAPMGEGKTEAALAVAEIFAARSGAGGCFVALPTMATGNAMFPRLLDWLGRLPDHRSGTGAHSVHLAHSKAALNRDYATLMRAGARTLAAIDVDGDEDRLSHRRDARRSASAELVAHQWLRGRKKGMLSSFVVGTIDQLLFAGLKSRHLALRHLAIAGKVVVIDEAHAYDTYMNVYLDRVLSWLGAYGVPVVVLSATLPSARRRELAEAYAGKRTDPVYFSELQDTTGYPLLTTVAPGTRPRTYLPEPSGRGVGVLTERLDDDVDALADRLQEELADGGCALVVRNTVARALEAAACLRDRFGTDNVTVAHARFLDLDRARNDAELLRRFGPPGKSGDERPAGPHIVVATQVAEQSLDIDFDLLVTDLCPVDLLLQRMGRLHRHPRGENQSGRPPALRTARCLITGADWSATPPAPVSGSARVYGEHLLLRTLAVLEPHLGGSADSTTTTTADSATADPPHPLPVRLPADISPLVQDAYGTGPAGPPDWQDAMERARTEHDVQRAKQRDKANDFLLDEAKRDGRALLGWIDAGVGDADDTPAGHAQVRDTAENLEVLVVSRRTDGALTVVPWADSKHAGAEIPVDTVPPPALARTVAACGLRLPYHFSFPQVLDQAIEELEERCVPAWQAKESHWLAGELILVLDEDCRTRLAGFDLHYSPTDGLEVTRAQ
ncbi:CRISPR-associated helicase Cas3' [Streptomyces sodiiphilus]|uniref:CRISPR-associated helicase Cas3' n=1 Tax=Streptomyces sodiiphilus TaxID=226217 RepID=UPI003CD0A848